MRVACLAWDSPDLELLREGVADGWLPTLAALAARGSFVLLDDTQEILTPASWPTLARGVAPARHGLLCDQQLVPGEYRIASMTADDATEPPFWAHLGAAGLRSTIVGIYSAPLLPGLPGVQVVGWGSHDPFTTKHDGPRAEPAEVLGELRDVVGRRTLRHGRRLPVTPEEHLAYVDEVVRGLGQQGRAVAHLARRDRWDFLCATFADGHEAGHVLWRHHDPGHPAHDPGAHPRVRGALREIAQATDAALAEVLAALDDDVVVLITTPYGMGRDDRCVAVVDDVLRAHGLRADRAPGSGAPDRRTAALGLARRAARAVLPQRARVRLVRKLGSGFEIAHVLAFATMDPAGTRAFALPSDGPALLRVNLEGREPAGAVAPEDYEAVRDELIAAFTALRDADSGEPVVARAVRFEEVAGCRPTGAMPDVMVAWIRNARPRALRDAGGAEFAVPRDHPIGGMHWCTGFVLGAGPGIAAAGAGLDGASGELVDLGATVLALFGLPRPEAMTGRPLFGLADGLHPAATSDRT